MSTWNLDALYTGYESKEFLSDFEALPGVIEKLNNFTATHTELTVSTCEELLKLLGEYTLSSGKLERFISFNGSTNTSDTVTIGYRTKIGAITSTSAKSMSVAKKLLANIDLDSFAAESALIKEHYFMLSEIKDSSVYMLSDDVEDAMSKLNINAASAWGSLQSYLTSTVKVDYNGEVLTLPQVRNLAYSSDPEVRKAAYEAELAAYEKIKDSSAFALNSIKGQSNTVAQMRGYESVLDMTLKGSRLSAETLQAMLSAIEKYLPKFHEYLRHKANILGYKDGLPFYEMYTRVGSDDSSEFTIEEAKDHLMKNFSTFSAPLANLVAQAYDERWIDFYPRAGKVGGAFCGNIPYLKQSRILMNYGGTLSDVVTLAHELGHAYHGKCIEDMSILNTRYTMPVAETASTFNETIIMNAAIADAKSDDAKAGLIEKALQDLTQVICDIYSRYLFESEVVDRRKAEFMLSDELCDIMLRAQKKAYGTGLDNNLLHKYMWVNKGHYYSAGLNFYNFPYAFGALFSKGLYAQYKKDEASFVANYDKLLNATVTSSCEDVAKMANIDITKQEFWNDSLEIVSGYIDEFIALTSK